MKEGLDVEPRVEGTGTLEAASVEGWIPEEEGEPEREGEALEDTLEDRVPEGEGEALRDTGQPV